MIEYYLPNNNKNTHFAKIFASKQALIVVLCRLGVPGAVHLRSADTAVVRASTDDDWDILAAFWHALG